MSWWKRLFGDDEQENSSDRHEVTGRPAARPIAATPAKSPSADPIASVMLYGTPQGPTTEQLRRIVGEFLPTPRQKELIEALVQVYEQLPEDILHDTALVLVDRGQPQMAAEFLRRCSSPSDMLLRADLLDSQGRTSEALSIVERVLAYDITTPGAKERHQRWSRKLVPTLSPIRRMPPPAAASRARDQTPFAILKEVARGGAAIIYHARDERLGRDIALKIYHHGRKDTEQLEREASQAAKFASRGVVRVFDLDPEQGWLAMGWYQAGSLQGALQQGSTETNSSVVSWLTQLASTLDRIHAEGYVHADLKPSNLLFSQDGHIVLSDFGLCVEAGSPNPGGSPGYMSPERLAGEPIAPDDDVYAFGRIIEDFRHAEWIDPTLWFQLENWQQACLQPRGKRPASGKELLSLLSVNRDSEQSN